MGTKITMGAVELVELGRKCKAGQVLRKGYSRAGYTREDGTRVARASVAPSCVPDKGAAGKTPASRKFAEFGPNYLPGWHKDRSIEARHEALRRQTAREGCVRVIRKLTQLRNVTTDAPTEQKAKRDAKWLHDQNFCRLKTKDR